MEPTRRTLLRASAVGIVGGLAGCAGANEPYHEDTTTTPAEGMGGTTTTQQPEETVVLGAETSHWFGLAPSSIHGKRNPTLALQPGTVYEIVVVNLDGVGHRLRVLNADGGEVAVAETVSEVGVTTAVVFEATDRLARYECEFHPSTMNGKVTSAKMTETTTTTTTTEGGGPY